MTKSGANQRRAQMSNAQMNQNNNRNNSAQPQVGSAVAAAGSPASAGVVGTPGGAGVAAAPVGSPAVAQAAQPST